MGTVSNQLIISQVQSREMKTKMRMTVGRAPNIMYQYYHTTKNHILTQTASDSLSDAISETMKKLSMKARKQMKKKMERPKAASYSVDIEISRYHERERDEDEYSIIGLDEIHDTEVNNNEILADWQENESEPDNNEDFDSFNLLRMRSRSLGSQKINWDNESCAEVVDGLMEDTEEESPPELEEEGSPAISSLNAALQAFSLSAAKDRDKMASKLPDPLHVSVSVRDRFSLERAGSMITLPMMTKNQITSRPRTAPDNSDLEREWRKMMMKNVRPRRQMSV